MKKKLFIVGFFSLLSHTQIFDSNDLIPSVHEAFTISTDLENQNIFINFGLMPKTYIYLDKINLKDSNDSDIYFEFQGNEKEKKDIFFGLTKIFDSDFNIKFVPKNEEKVVLSYQGCFKNKVCYPNKIKNIFIKYDKKRISSVKID